MVNQKLEEHGHDVLVPDDKVQVGATSKLKSDAVPRVEGDLAIILPQLARITKAHVLAHDPEAAGKGAVDEACYVLNSAASARPLDVIQFQHSLPPYQIRLDFNALTQNRFGRLNAMLLNGHVEVGLLLESLIQIALVFLLLIIQFLHDFDFM